ncbi:MAG TPA: SAM-dependent methyltransferase [Acidimicrobiales bacterium]|nr:SAM-dependent methyltransferase [Acidimicrobiales bacterium]
MKSQAHEGSWEWFEIDRSVAHVARTYDYLLGGTDNFAVDREAAEAHGKAVGGIENSRHAVRANRRFLSRAVRYLAGEAGIRQFLDLGSGIPTRENVHQVAQRIAPGARVVYVDNDPVVLAHAQTLLNGTPEGSTAYVMADLSDPEPVLAEAASTLDFAQPVAVLFVSMLHFFPDDVDPCGIVARYIEQMTSGSYLVVSHMARDIQPEAIAALAEATAEDDTIGYEFYPRTRAEVARFLDGVELVKPGVVPVEDWIPDGPPPRRPAGIGEPPFHAGIGYKP